MLNEFIRKGNKFLLTSIGLFVLSLTQKCYCTTSHCADSIMAFLLGWAGILSSGATISWLANPLLILSWAFMKKNPRISIFLSVFAFLFALSFLLFGQVLANESGQQQPVISYRMGYWLWVGSAAVMLLGNFITVYRLNMQDRR